MPRISRFSPNWSDPKALEAITVAREDLISDAVDAIRESSLTKNKHHLLFVGPRGSGKTHLITLLHHRVIQMDDVVAKLRVAWLNEDETSDSVLSLLLRVHRALAKEYPTDFPPESTEPVYDLSDRSEATEAISELLLRQLGGHTLLLLIENLDALFSELNEGEQKRWRALIQNHPRFCTISTAQRLFSGVSDRDAPFFGFFNVQHLKPFTVDNAVELLGKIALEKKDTELAMFIASPRGRARIRALHHLTGGNQRLFIILSEFIDRESLESLVTPFEELVDEQLTPYYQERLRWLSTLQRKIVEYLCSNAKPQPVKAIARQLFATPQTVSSQLMALREMGYLQSRKRGRESLYELAEPLMRLSHEVKEAKGRAPLRILVDFLRVWYDHEELEQWIQLAPSNAETTRLYLGEAHTRSGIEGNLRLNFFKEDAEGIDPAHCDEQQLGLLCDLKNESNDPQDILNYGVALGFHGQLEGACAEFTSVARLEDASCAQICWAYYNRGIAQKELGNIHAEIADYTSVIDRIGAPPEAFAKALNNRGFAHRELGDTLKAIADYTTVIERDDVPTDQIVHAFINRGFSHGKQGDLDAAIIDCTTIIEKYEASQEAIATALFNRGVALNILGDIDAAIADYSNVVIQDDIPPDLSAQANFNCGVAHTKKGNIKAAIANYTEVIRLKDAPSDQIASAFINRGFSLGKLGYNDAEIADYTSVIKLDNAPQRYISRAHFNAAVVEMRRDNWTVARRHVTSGFDKVDSVDSDYVGPIPDYIHTILTSGQSLEIWRPRLDMLLEIYVANNCLIRFARGLVDSIPTLRESKLSPEGLSEWHAVWVEQAESHPELELPSRLLRTAIDYFVANEDESVLLDLPSEERRILSQVLGLEQSENDQDSD